jgi:hypothetical protein
LCTNLDMLMLQSNEALSVTPLFTYDNIEDNKVQI